MPVTSPFSALVSAFDHAGVTWGDDLAAAKRAVETSVAGTAGLLGVGYGKSVTRVPGDTDQAVVVWLRPGTPETSLPVHVKMGGSAADGRPARSIPVRVVRADPGAYLADRANTEPESGFYAAERRLWSVTGHLPYLRGPIPGEATHVVYGATPMRTWRNESRAPAYLFPMFAEDRSAGRSTERPPALPEGTPLSAGTYEVWVDDGTGALRRVPERVRLEDGAPAGDLVLIDTPGGGLGGRKLGWRLDNGREPTLYASGDDRVWLFSPPIATLFRPKKIEGILWGWTSDGVVARVHSQEAPFARVDPNRMGMLPGPYAVSVKEGDTWVPLRETLRLSPQMPSAILVLRRHGRAPAYRWFAVNPEGTRQFALDLVPLGNGRSVWTYDVSTPHGWEPIPRSSAVADRFGAAHRFGQDVPTSGAGWLQQMNLAGFLLGG